MTAEQHYKNLEHMYHHNAPINEIFKPVLKVSKGETMIEMEVIREFLHAAGTMHGAVYFKMLDDAAYFAANSLIMDYFVFTVSFTVHFIKPVNSGKIKAVGKVQQMTRNMVFSESMLFDAKGKKIATGSGTFAKTTFELSSKNGYGE